jgi:hypothetical protein
MSTKFVFLFLNILNFYTMEFNSPKVVDHSINNLFTAFGISEERCAEMLTQFKGVVESLTILDLGTNSILIEKFGAIAKTPEELAIVMFKAGLAMKKLADKAKGGGLLSSDEPEPVITQQLRDRIQEKIAEGLKRCDIDKEHMPNIAKILMKHVEGEVSKRGLNGVMVLQGEADSFPVNIELDFRKLSEGIPSTSFDSRKDIVQEAIDAMKGKS